MERGEGSKFQMSASLLPIDFSRREKKIAISRLEVAIVAILNDKNNRMLDPVIIPIETKRYAN